MTAPPGVTARPDRAAIARLLLFVAEVPPGSNRGRWVEALQRIGDAGPGDPWCMCFVVAVLELDYAGKSPLPAQASCEAAHQYARGRGWVDATPKPGDVFLLLNAEGHAHHCGLVLSVPPSGRTIHEISGNTNSDGGREGYAVVERDRALSPLLVFVHLPPTTP